MSFPLARLEKSLTKFSLDLWLGGREEGGSKGVLRSHKQSRPPGAPGWEDLGFGRAANKDRLSPDAVYCTTLTQYPTALLLSPLFRWGNPSLKKGVPTPTRTVETGDMGSDPVTPACTA